MENALQSDKYAFLNTYIQNYSIDETAQKIIQLAEEKKGGYVTPVNVDVINKTEKNEQLKTALDNASICVLDGMPLVWISKLYKRPVKEKVSGSDLVPYLLLKMATKKMSVFILGSTDDVAETAMTNIQKTYKGIVSAGTYSPWNFEKNEEELKKIDEIISEANPDIVLACFGCPKQEIWAYHHHSIEQPHVTICAGATVDFIAGNVKRCPRWMSEHGLEWFYRFLKEPKRLFKRYFIEGPKILLLAFKYRRQKNN